MSKEVFEYKSKQIFSQIFSPSFFLPQHIGIYVSYHHEVDTLPIIQQLLNLHKNVYVPKVLDDHTMVFVEIFTLEQLKEGYRGILEPIYDKKDIVMPDQIEMMFTPLVAYNNRLERVGQGGGYYDRYFKDYKGRKIGLAFENQCFDFEADSFDQPLDMIINENNILTK